MNNHRCTSEKSLVTVRKWLLQSGDGLSTIIHTTPSKLDHNVKQKPYLNKVIKRKRSNSQKCYPKTTSLINWLYEFIKNVFTVYDESPLKSEDQFINDTNASVMTCSTCQLDNADTQMNVYSSFQNNSPQSDLDSKINSNKVVTIPASSKSFNNSKSTQANYSKDQSSVYPLYCFSVKDGQIVPLTFSSPTSTTIIPMVKEIISSSPLSIHKKMLTNCDKTIQKTFLQSTDPPLDLPLPLLTKDIHSYGSHRSTVSLQTTQNHIDSHTMSKDHYPASSLNDQHDIKCDLPVHAENNFLFNARLSSTTNTNNPDIVFAKSTCQLIKQAWLSSKTDQQANL